MEFTDEIVREKLAKGERIEFPVPRVIKATWITELIRNRQTGLPEYRPEIYRALRCY